MNNIYSELIKQAEKTPDKIAIVHGDKSISYRNLYEKANMYACFLKDKDIGNEDIVCISANRSIALIACIIGVLQSGGAYLTIDPQLSSSKIRDMIADTNSRFMFADDILELDTALSAIKLDEISCMPPSNQHIVPCTRTTNSLAYIVYTSGTSGQPKAVMVEDGNILAYIRAYHQILNVVATDKTLQQSPCFYDGFAEEIYSMLLCGGTVVLPEAADLQNPRLIKKIIEKQRVTLLATTPIMLNELNNLERIDSIRAFISSGDVLKSRNYSHLIQYCEVYNMYGPTETTVCATYYRCTATDTGKTSIGQAIPGYFIHVLDEQLQPVPNGLSGNIYISGAGVSRGFLHDTNRTDIAFIKTSDGCRLYDTGDIASWDENGYLLYHGRKDRQVKIKGRRIEPLEIEIAAERLDGIRQAVVLVKETAEDEKQLCLFYISSGSTNTQKIREHLRECLPAHMVPMIITEINHIPLTVTGKIDNTKLLNSLPKYMDVKIASENSLEARFSEVIRTSLGDEIIKSEILFDDKLDELGIHSILFITMVLNLEQEFDFQFDDDDLLMTNYDTIKDLYEYIKTKSTM